jgi:hypothetical protein
LVGMAVSALPCHPCKPFGNDVACQVRDRDIAESGQDMKPRPPLGVGQGSRSLMLQAFEICGHRGGDRESSFFWCFGKRRDLARPALRLKEVENAVSGIQRRRIWS